jgi:hypothetical protein
MDRMVNEAILKSTSGQQAKKIAPKQPLAALFQTYLS